MEAVLQRIKKLSGNRRAFWIRSKEDVGSRLIWQKKLRDTLYTTIGSSELKPICQLNYLGSQTDISFDTTDKESENKIAKATKENPQSEERYQNWCSLSYGMAYVFYMDLKHG